MSPRAHSRPLIEVLSSLESKLSCFQSESSKTHPPLDHLIVNPERNTIADSSTQPTAAPGSDTAQDARTNTSIQSAEPVVSSDHNIMSFTDGVGALESVVTAKDRNDSTNPFMDIDISPFVHRPYLQSTFNWSSTQAAGTTVLQFSPWKVLWDNAQDYLKKFRYHRFGIKVTIMMQSTMMHYGKLIAYWLPCCAPSAYPQIALKSAFALDVDIIDAAHPDKLTIDIPFMFPLKWADASSLFGQNELGGPKFFLQVLNPVGNAQATTATVPISVYIEAYDYSGSAPITTTTNLPSMATMFQSDSTTFSESHEKRDATDASPVYVSQRQLASIGQSHEADTTIKLAMSASHEMDYSKNMVQALIEDEHNVRAICKRPSLLFSTTITPSTTGNFIDLQPSPDYCLVVPGQINYATNAQVVSRLATYWHGTMKYRVSFSMSKITTVRIGVVFNWRKGGQANTNDHIAAIWDITGSEDRTFSVPYHSPFPYVPTSNWSQPQNFLAFDYYGIPQINFIILNPITSGTVTTVPPVGYMNVFAAIDDDMRFYIPKGFSEDALVLNVQPSFMQDNLAASFVPDFPVPGVDTSPPELPNYNFGEEFLDIRDLFTRYTKNQVVPVGAHTLVRSMPLVYKNLYRFMRYGMRYKLVDETTSQVTHWFRRNDTVPSTGPSDLVPDPKVPIAQIEIPYYECWYYDLPQTKPTSQVQVNVPGANPHTLYAAVSSDSVFSFWTFAVQWNAPASPPALTQMAPALNATETPKSLGV